MISMENGVPKLVLDQNAREDCGKTVAHTLKENYKCITDTLNQIKNSQKSTFDLKKFECIVSSKDALLEFKS